MTALIASPWRRAIHPTRHSLVAAVVFGSLAAAMQPAAAAELAERYVVDVYKPERTSGGTTIFVDYTDKAIPLIVEVDMAGKVIWTYRIPADRQGNGGTETEWIPTTDNILFTQKSVVYEVNRAGKIVWSDKTPSSHDADRLPNGNTLVVWGWGENSSDPEVREIEPSGKVVWKWHAEPHLKGETRLFDHEGLTHTNSAVRLANGHTLISLRNYFMLVEVNPAGDIVWKLPNLKTTPHDPEILANGNILVNTRTPQVLNEITPAGLIVWQYQPKPGDMDTIRYNHRLPNGNTILVEHKKIVEIAPNSEIVWQLRLANVSPDDGDQPNPSQRQG